MQEQNQEAQISLAKSKESGVQSCKAFERKQQSWMQEVEGKHREIQSACIEGQGCGA